MHTLHYFVQKQKKCPFLKKQSKKKRGGTIMLPLAFAPDILLNINNGA
jgi:hypothetical protein